MKPKAAPKRRTPTEPPPQDPRDRRLRELEERVEYLEARLGSQRLVADAPPLPPTPTFVPEPVRASPLLSPPPPRPPRAPIDVPPPRDLERTLGGKWLGLAGMLVLVLGVVFFLKYAFDQGWITRPFRIVLGIAGGAAIASLGDLLRRREGFQIYSQILTGGGFVIVYFSLFAAYQFPEYRDATGITLELDSALLGLTAFGLCGYAVWRRTPLLAAEGIVLGNLAAVFAEKFTAFALVYLAVLTGAVLVAALRRGWTYVAFATLVSFGTLALLRLSDIESLLIASTATVIGAFLLVVAAYRRWESLGGLALGASLLIIAICFDDAPSGVALSLLASGLGVLGVGAGAWRAWPYHYLPAILGAHGVYAIALSVGSEPYAILAIAGGTFVTSLTSFFFRSATAARDQEWSAVSAVMILAAWGVALFALERAAHLDYQGPTTGAFALTGLGLALLRAAPADLRRGWAAAGILLALAWPPVQFDGTATTLGWAGLLVAAVVYQYLRPGRIIRYLVLAPALLLSLHLATFEAGRLATDELDPLRAALPFGAAVIALLAAWIVAGPRAPDEPVVARILLTGALVWPLVYFGFTLDGFVISIAWASEGVLLVVVGFALKLSDLRFAALAVFALVLGKIFLVDITALELVFRIVTFLAVGALLLVGAFLYTRLRTPLAKEPPV